MLRAESIPAEAWLIASELHEVCVSPAVEREWRAVMVRPKFRRYIDLPAATAFLDGVLARATHVEPQIAVADCRDPKDNKVLELALAAGAAVIVSSDQDLLTLHPWRGIEVLTPADFCARFGT